MTLNNEPNKFGRISVQIEEVDESWALKLLNESEQEDYAILLQDGHQESSYLRVHTEAKDTTTRPMSAIEYQIQEQERKNQSARDSRQNLKKSRLSFSTFKGFFVA